MPWPKQKLDAEKVLEMFHMRRAGRTRREIADVFDISEVYAGQILSGMYWTDAYPNHPDRLAVVAQAKANGQAACCRRVANAARNAYGRAARAYRAGAGLREAARAGGVHWVALGRWMDRQGIPRRPSLFQLAERAGPWQAVALAAIPGRGQPGVTVDDVRAAVAAGRGLGVSDDDARDWVREQHAVGVLTRSGRGVRGDVFRYNRAVPG